MDSGHIFFDSSSSGGHGGMLYLGNGDSLFRGGRLGESMEEAFKRRPFFSSPEELFDEEYYDEQLPEKKRRLTPDQVTMLEKSFEADNKLEPERKTQLAKKLGLQPRQVAVWFQNRRARWKTKQLERDFDDLKSSFDNLQADYKSILKDNENLKSEVVSLTEKLQAKEIVTAPASSMKLDSLPADHLSSGTVGSAVVDEDGPQLVDSCNSDFPNADVGSGTAYMLPVDGVQSEDGGSDDGHSYLTDVFAAEDHQGWWVWS